MRRNRSGVFLISLIFVVAVMVGFTGCAEQSGGGKPFSQSLTGEEPRIWYECQNKIEQSEDETTYIIEDEETSITEAPVFGRETKVIWIKVYKDGKLSTYSCMENVNLGHFSKMTDEEILKELDSDKDSYLCGQKDQPYEICLYTDAAGQEVLFEGIPSLIKQSKKADPMYFMTLISKDQIPTFQVYDSYYGGYVLYNYDEGLLKEACLVTRCDKDENFGLDGMDLENAVLDYLTPEEMLHEKNISLKNEAKKASGDKPENNDQGQKEDATEETAEEDTETP